MTPIDDDAEIEDMANALKPFLYDLEGPDLHIRAAKAGRAASRAHKLLPEVLAENARLREALEYLEISLNGEFDEHLLAIQRVCRSALNHQQKDDANG